PPLRVDGSGVVDEHFQPGIALERLGRQAPDRGLGSQVGEQDVDLSVGTRSSLHLPDGFAGSGLAAGDDGKLCPAPGEVLRSRQTDPSGRSSDPHALARAALPLCHDGVCTSLDMAGMTSRAKRSMERSDLSSASVPNANVATK